MAEAQLRAQRELHEQELAAQRELYEKELAAQRELYHTVYEKELTAQRERYEKALKEQRQRYEQYLEEHFAAQKLQASGSAAGSPKAGLLCRHLCCAHTATDRLHAARYLKLVVYLVLPATSLPDALLRWLPLAMRVQAAACRWTAPPEFYCVPCQLALGCTQPRRACPATCSL